MEDARTSPNPITPAGSWSPVLRTAIRVLTFRATRDELLAMDRRHLALGLACTWIVGVGRWWDDPGAHVVQHVGLGSVVYVFALSAFLWLMIRPLNPRNFSYVNLLTYVTLTAPPAILYALPVERWMELGDARTVNAWFLAIVAAWRVAILVVYLRRVASFNWRRLTIALLLPLTGIVNALAIFNLERAVFRIMAGLREEVEPLPPTANDEAYLILVVISVLSLYTLPILIGTYFFTIWSDTRARIQELNTDDPIES